MNKEIHPLRFESIYCRHFHCSSKHFASHMLWQCFSWPFPFSIAGRLIALMRPGILKPDFVAIDHIGRTCDHSEFLDELEDFQYLRFRDGTFFRRRFRFCLSVSKLKRIGRILFAE